MNFVEKSKYRPNSQNLGISIKMMCGKYINQVAYCGLGFKPNFFGKVEFNKTIYVSNFTVVTVVQLQAGG